MSMSTFQKVTLFSCVVLCVSLLLPKILLSRGKKDVGQQDAGPGRFPPMMQQQQMSDSQAQWGVRPPNSKAYNPDGLTKGKGVGTVGRGGGKSNLMGRIIPIYGFGILLYILYILFKITSKGKNVKTETRFPAQKSENTKRKITDYELAQLQEKLKETEEVMEKIVSNAGDSPDRIRSVTAEHEERLLHQLKEITRVMQEGKLVEGISLGSQLEDWEDEPEEVYPPYSEASCRTRYGNIRMGERTAEELAEGVGKVMEEAELEGELRLPRLFTQDSLDEWEEVEGVEARGHWPHSMNQVGQRGGAEDCSKEGVEPVVKAERMSFCSAGCDGDYTQDEVESFLHASDSEDTDGFSKSEITAELGVGVLRKRGKREPE
ncbi:protein RIC-3b [Brienomyrus brachyistius]|uniref:protein RIC-3b n=1 Tax=Brienomyrus brachyistius TaxID=42636 RepID=UPI0020B46081|nr:protein RIC-3b [Brienomyrus brachyistius]